MYKIYTTVKERLQRYLMAESFIKEDLMAGSTVVKIDGVAMDFTSESLNDITPHLLLMDSDSTGERTQEGFNGCELLTVKNIGSDGTLTLSSPVERNWLVSNGSLVRRAPGGVAVINVVIGDLKVVSKFPTICVVPADKNIDWAALALTKDSVNINIIAYIESGNTEMGTIDALKLTDVIEWIMMSNLHLKVEGGFEPWQLTSNAGIKNVDYGVIQKGNEFLKACKMTWFGEIYKDRTDIYERHTYERKN